MTADTESCAICFDDYKGKKVVKVTCQYCPSHACRACQQRYLLQSYEDPHCMQCKRGWAPEFMAANFPLIFRNDALRKHRRKILFEREKAVLPAMQDYVGYKKEEERIAAEIAEFKKTFGSGNAYNRVTGTRNAQNAHEADEATTLTYRFGTIYTKRNDAVNALSVARSKLQQWKTGFDWQGNAVTPAQVAEARRTRDACKKVLEELEAEYEPIAREYHAQNQKLGQLQASFWEQRARYEDRWGGAGSATEKREKREFIMKCPDGDCRGFLSSAYKCGTCSKHTCSQCLVVLGTEKDSSHVCNKDDVESAKAIKAETRPCPKCGARIFKIDGCDQMFCTVEGCHTAFSWNTGHVVTGVIHNPHYYEWLRRTGGGQAPREAGDIPCGGLPTYGQLYDATRRCGIVGYGYGIIAAAGDNDLVGTLAEVHRCLTELINMRLREYPARPPAMANKDHDVAYLMQKMDEAEWRRQLEFTEAKFRRKKEIGQILQMAATAGSDAMNRIVQELQRFVRDGFPAQGRIWLRETGLPELEQLREFVNQSLKDLAKREHMAVPQFGEKWRWTPLRALYKAPGGARKKKGAAGEEATSENTIVPAGTGLVAATEDDEVIEILDE